MSREPDPESLAARDSLTDLPLRRQAVHAVLAEFGPSTDVDLLGHYVALRTWAERGDARRWRWLPQQSVSGLRTRRRELVDAGHVVDTGERVRLDSGRLAKVWAAK